MTNRSKRPSLLLSVLIAGIAAVIVGVTVSALVTQLRSHADAIPPPGDRVRAAITALKTDHLYIAPDAEDKLTAAQQQTIREAAAQADPQVFITIWNPSRYDGFYLDADALDQITAGVARKGVYLIAGDRTSGTDEQYGVSGGFVSSQLTGEFDKALLRYVAAVDAGDYQNGSGESFDYWGGLGGGLAAGGLMALGAYFAAMLIVSIGRVVAGRTFLAPASWLTQQTSATAALAPARSRKRKGRR